VAPFTAGVMIFAWMSATEAEVEMVIFGGLSTEVNRLESNTWVQPVARRGMDSKKTSLFMGSPELRVYPAGLDFTRRKQYGISAMDIVLYPNEVLRQKTVLVTEFDAALGLFAQEMIQTMIEGRGIGLAAPQVGKLISVFTAQDEDGKPLIFINPEIIGTSLETVPYEEGCLSIPGMYEEVVRPEAVVIQAYNEKGRPFKRECDGLLARIVQHELDHLKGVMFIDYLSEMKRDRLLKQYQKNLKK